MKRKEKEFNVPILIIAFNRYFTTEKVLNSLRGIKPKKIYLSLDFPRAGNSNDVEEQKKIISLFDDIDWECELKINKHKENQGCKYGPSKAIDWFFENEDKGIILEDDIVAENFFFYYCEILLEKYEFDDRVGLICGSNFASNRDVIQGSYDFSYYNHIWGWATWKRAWIKNEIEMDSWKQEGKGVISNIFFDVKTKKYWEYYFERAFQNRIDAWDYQWLYSCWKHKMLAILPKESLVENIGFGEDATHTFTAPKFVQNAKVDKFQNTIIHTEYIIRNINLDEDISRTVFVISWFSVLKNFLRRKIKEKF
ncbi:hypothetical protein QJ358_001476 [Vibrio vulnificus]|nr:hypothetical protein [Vibrio vulnificus]